MWRREDNPRCHSSGNTHFVWRDRAFHRGLGVAKQTSLCGQSVQEVTLDSPPQLWHCKHAPTLIFFLNEPRYQIQVPILLQQALY